MALGDTPRVMRPFSFRAPATLAEAARFQPARSKPRFTRWRQNMPEDVRFPAPAINRPSRKKWSVRRSGCADSARNHSAPAPAHWKQRTVAARSSHAALGGKDRHATRCLRSHREAWLRSKIAPRKPCQEAPAPATVSRGPSKAKSTQTVPLSTGPVSVQEARAPRDP